MKNKSRTQEADADSISELAQKLIQLARRRRWWIIGPAALVAAAGAAYVSKIPNTYSSDAVIMVMQPSVSSRFVDAGITNSVADEVNGLKQEILSRGRILEIVREMDLFEDEEERKDPSRAVARLQSDIAVDPVDQTREGNFTTFSVAYTGTSPEQSKQVVTKVASLFIQSNLARQGEQTGAGRDFLSQQVQQAKKKLDELDAQLTSFKLGHTGELPAQAAENAMALTSVQMRMQSVQGDLDRAQQQLRTAQSTARGVVQRLEGELTVLLGRYRDQHALVIAKNQEIANAKAFLAQISGGQSSGIAIPDAGPMAQLVRDAETARGEIEGFRAELERLQLEGARSQTRLRAAPVREQQLSQITRDYEITRKNYEDLLDKQMNSEMAATLSDNKQGRIFRVIDAPSLPTQPSGPRRLPLCAGSIGAGLVLGLLLALVRDSRDSSFYTERDLRDEFDPPFVISVPQILTSVEKQQRRNKTVLQWVAAGVLLLAVAAVEFYVYKLS